MGICGSKSVNDTDGKVPDCMLVSGGVDKQMVWTNAQTFQVYKKFMGYHEGTIKC